jgi:hypothetical protein
MPQRDGELLVLSKQPSDFLETFVARQLMSRFHRESEPNCFGDGNQRGQTRVAIRRQRAVQTLALDASGLGDLGYTLRLGEVAQGNQQNAGLVFIFQCCFQVLGGEIGVLPEASNYGLIVGDAGFTFHEVSLLSL